MSDFLCSTFRFKKSLAHSWIKNHWAPWLHVYMDRSLIRCVLAKQMDVISGPQKVASNFCKA